MGEFRRQMKYKSQWNGEHLMYADRFFPSSKHCHCCSWKWDGMQVSDRVYLCQNPACPLYQVPQDRDVNASQNLEGLAKEEASALKNVVNGELHRT
jgi:putative transposase